ncbi:MAG TPA: hypothetical protein VGF50_00820 [Caulobacteraceae bacterium]|jgi:hypothetical protein
MRSLALVLLAAFPFLGAMALAWILPGQSFARRYSRARQKTAAMTAVSDTQRERNAESATRLAAGERRGDDG